jgi:hypothetical protein
MLKKRTRHCNFLSAKGITSIDAMAFYIYAKNGTVLRLEYPIV